MIDPLVGMSRISNRSKYDRLDQETVIFHQRVREGYQKIAKMYPNRIVTIDGTQSIEKIKEQIISKIKESI